MQVERTITFIVSRNFGHPLTWNVKAWRVYAGGAVAAVLLLSMLTMSLLFLVSMPRVNDLERETKSLREERDALRTELQQAGNAAMQRKLAAWIAANAESGQPRSGLSGIDVEEEEFYVQPVRLDSFSARRARRSLEAKFRIVRQGRPEGHRGGFIFAIFEDQTTAPPRFAASPQVDVNEQGFPQFYKGGIRFSRIRNAQTYRRSIRLGRDEGRYTHVTIYLFSLRGGLLAKERYALDPALFAAST